DVAPDRPVVWVQIEGAQGVARAVELGGVDGVDALVVGTADLSFDLGSPLDVGSPEVVDAVGAVRMAADGAGVAFGVAGALSPELVALADGAGILVLGTDARLCAGAAHEAARRMRELVAPTITTGVHA